MATSKKQLSPLFNLMEELNVLADRIESSDPFVDARGSKKLRHSIEETVDRLIRVASCLDPVLRPDSIFDPTDPNTAGRVVALTLVAQPMHSLANIPDFYGAGVYAIYYKGDFTPYSMLKGKEHPIYVGKADPDHPAAKDAISQGTKLSMRLREHAKNICKAKSTLKIEDFECRFLIVQTGFQKSAEDYLINFFKPIWNSETKICFGLGKHGDSSDTRGNKRSPWDTIHPGRPWAENIMENQKSPELIVEQISTHLERYAPYKNIQEIFSHFVMDMSQLSASHFSTPAQGAIDIE